MTQPISSSPLQSSHYSAPEAAEAAGPPSASCDDEIVEVVRAGVAVAGSVAALVAATPTVIGVLPGIAAFVGSSLYLGQAAADLSNCNEQATAKPE